VCVCVVVVVSHGRIGVIGNRGDVTVNARYLMAKESSVVGVSLGGQTREERAEAQAFILSKLAAGVLSPVVGEEYPLAEVRKALEAVIGNKSKGKVVLNCA